MNSVASYFARGTSQTLFRSCSLEKKAFEMTNSTLEQCIFHLIAIYSNATIGNVEFIVDSS